MQGDPRSAADPPAGESSPAPRDAPRGRRAGLAPGAGRAHGRPTDPEPLSGRGTPAGPESLSPADAALSRRLDLIRVVIGVVIGILLVTAVVEIADEGGSALEWLSAALVVLLGIALVLHHFVHAALSSRRLAREVSMTRIVQGLSRSLSPDEVVDAIIAELRAASGADHVVVARVRHPDQVVEVTLVASSGSAPPSTTYLRPEAELSTERAAERARRAARAAAETAATPGVEGAAGAAAIAVLEPSRSPLVASQAAADEIARRVRSAYGLMHTLAEPLVADRRFLGALIIAKRTRESWSDPDRRMLTWAAAEVSAAFARAYALEEAERGANTDALTGLPNRRYFDDLLAIMPRRRSTDSLGILMIDIDRFKRLNDVYGHATGDAVLRAVASAIAMSLRAEDTPARYGGEEFAVILRRASAPQATDVAERVRRSIASIPPARLGVAEPVTASVGVATALEGEDVRAVLERADQALYVAKRTGRNRVEVA
jgi:diguanylate cyclase (GGDEF)-like protein